jgi:hypothetical protein
LAVFAAHATGEEVVMGLHRRSVAAAVVLALAAAATVAGAAHGMAGGCSSGQVLKSKSYVFALSIGPVEKMYTRVEVKSKHPSSGEVMLSGTMSGGMAGMDMPMGGQKHLEVHICTPSGAVVMHAHPTIVVDDPKANPPVTKVPIAVMEGIGEGASDLHYGNNVSLTAGHAVTVTVTLAGEKVVFHTTVSKSGM